MITTIKIHMPEPVKAMARARSRAILAYGCRRLVAYYAGSASRKHAQSQLGAKMVFFAHRLEAGLSHSETCYQFGINAVRNLASAMSRFNPSGFDRSPAVNENAFAVLREYLALHAAAGESIEHVKGISSEATIGEALGCDSCLGGILNVYKKDNSDGRDRNFRDLPIGRWSIRKSADIQADMNLLAEAIQIAIKAPSVCNRQSARVAVLTGREMVRRILDVERGATGYLLPLILLVISTETSASLSGTERTESTRTVVYSRWRYSSILRMSLAACALNAMFTVGDESKMRHVAGIPESEHIIVFVAVGNLKEQVSVPKSVRFPGSERMRGQRGRRCIALGESADIWSHIFRISSPSLRRTKHSHSQFPENRSLSGSTDRSPSSRPVLHPPLALALELAAWEMSALGGARLAGATGESAAGTTRSFVQPLTAHCDGAGAELGHGGALLVLPATSRYSAARTSKAGYVYHP